MVLTDTELPGNVITVPFEGILYLLFVGTLPRVVDHLGKSRQPQWRLSWYLSRPHNTPVSVGICGCYVRSESMYRFKHLTSSFCFPCSHAQAITY